MWKNQSHLNLRKKNKTNNFWICGFWRLFLLGCTNNWQITPLRGTHEFAHTGPFQFFSNSLFFSNKQKKKSCFFFLMFSCVPRVVRKFKNVILFTLSFICLSSIFVCSLRRVLLPEIFFSLFLFLKFSTLNSLGSLIACLILFTVTLSCLFPCVVNSSFLSSWPPSVLVFRN